MIVDDEETLTYSLYQSFILAKQNYEVVTASSGEEASDKLKAEKFDLVITDLAMPGLPGDKLSLELIKIRPDIPILLCSGFCEEEPEGIALSKGINCFLTKPISFKTLAQKVREVLDRNKGMS